MAELFPRHLIVVISAQAPDVAVVVGAALGQGEDVIRNRGDRDDPVSFAHAAQRLGFEAALASLDRGASSQPLGAHGHDFSRHAPLPPVLANGLQGACVDLIEPNPPSIRNGPNWLHTCE